ncbi:serine/threonine-protein kinase [Streptomyces sp. BA2]|uniref:serine/threonine-protein kinase n=1 Tax=Streptomyces sp. BA2 TaxID=436595 RepID=UPI001327470A|nr:serine/threonine-protein kinase [Streptomyces sp. BA2]MWA13037.1 protein kinase [Streptomyces sp. BA2]
MGSVGDNARVIAGRYRLDARLGRGGMGVVWQATDQFLGRRVAVKELALDDTLSESDAMQQRERTLREARAAAQLRHPHIIVVHDVVVQSDHPYIVMELIEGGSLAARISRAGPMSAREVARMGIALLGALRVAHAAGVLHRDIKPANVLMEEATGRVVLTDFGIAQVSGATTLTEIGSFVGSPEYTAPERMSGERTGPESDLWSLGALLVTAMTGESPFRRDSISGVLHAVVFDEIRPPPAAAPLLPVILGLLERDPERRLGVEDAERLLRTYVETGRMPSTPAGRAGGQPSALPGGRLGGYTPTYRDLPTRPPAQSAGPSRGRRRIMLIAAALVAAVAGAGVSAALLMGRDGDGDRGEPTTTATQSAPTKTVSPSPSPTPTVTVTRGSRTPKPSTPEAPEGYRVTKDRRGFTLAVPHGFTREVDGPRVFYKSAGGTFRIGIKESAPEPGGPLAVQRRSDAKGPENNPGYRDGEVTETSHNGRPAALWQFSWDGFTAAEGDRHTYDLCWEEGGRMYDVWVSAPIDKAEEGRRYFDTAVDSFVRR